VVSAVGHGVRCASRPRRLVQCPRPRRSNSLVTAIPAIRSLTHPLFYASTRCPPPTLALITATLPIIRIPHKTTSSSRRFSTLYTPHPHRLFLDFFFCGYLSSISLALFIGRTFGLFSSSLLVLPRGHFFTPRIISSTLHIAH
jgi:hypothetical protein